MFLYTSFEILLYVVSIFNTSANVKSYLIFIRIPYSPIISSHCKYFRIIDLLSSKGLLHHRNFHLPYH